jgi:hypothetical protein
MTRPLFTHEPRTEQEVVCLFGALLPYLDVSLTIDQVQTPFPDCRAHNSETGQPVRIEFELYGHHFLQHCHDPNACDMIICWIDDWGNWPDNLTVVQLWEVVRTKCTHIIERISDRIPGATWHEDPFIEQCLINGVTGVRLQRIQSILQFAQSHKLGPQWLNDAKGSFAVHDHDQFFKVYSDGLLAFPFSRLNAGDSFPQLVRDLNDAFGKEIVAVTDCNRKGIGGDVGDLFPTTDHLNKFFLVWETFASRRRDA